ncbi:MAG TPA: polyhydroxyalkanoic acid system family protein [Polyangiales bacterium]|jgi:hypothetical protein|nr:polyhydroxyalkanoic acid system family protein [Polyangiales bacterium]
MAHVKHDIRHGLSVDQAKKAAQLALQDYSKRFAEKGLRAHWTSDTRAEVEFTAKGTKVQAIVDVLPDVLRVDAQVPFVFVPFKGMAVKAVETEAQKWIQQVREAKSA